MANLRDMIFEVDESYQYNKEIFHMTVQIGRLEEMLFLELNKRQRQTLNRISELYNSREALAVSLVASKLAVEDTDDDFQQYMDYFYHEWNFEDKLIE